MDTVRADRVSGYGDADTMPALAKIAAEGALFERFYAASTYTIPSHMSIMTGLDPAEHGVLVEGARLSPSVPTLAELLEQSGYRTRAFTEGVYIGGRWGFDRGFEEYGELPRASVVGERLPEILDWIRAAPEDPYFLFLHSYAAHFPYGGYRGYRSSVPERGLLSDAQLQDLYERARTGGFESLSKEERDLCLLFNHMVARHEDMFPVEDNRMPADFSWSRYFEQDRAALIASYDARLASIDRAIAEIQATLVELGQWEDTLLIVLSDHGEAFFEHGAGRHDYLPFDEVLKVPLIVSYPRLFAEAGPQRPDGLAWHLDVLPTILGFAGVELPYEYAGVDLSAILRGAPADSGRSLHPVVARAPNRKPGRPLRRVVIEGDQKYIEGHEAFGDTRGLLFDLASDPHETANLRGERTEHLARLAEAARLHVEGLRLRTPVHQETGRPLDEGGEAVDLSLEQIEELRAFGYLGTDGDDD
ncbi:MAG: arylsulfatase A-like enzyme [Chlamydiales bacterium]|jgi:arylsulfatase A-like enzyme